MKKAIANFIQWLISADMKDARAEINARNQQSLYLYPGICIAIVALNLVNQSYARLVGSSVSNLILLGILIVTICGLYYRKRRHRSFHNATCLLYCAELPVMLIALLSSTVLDPGHEGISFLLFLSTMPILILDVPWHVLLDLTFWAALFLPVSYFCKPHELFVADLIHLALAYLCDVMAICVVLASRLAEVRSYRRVLIADKTDEQTGLYNRKYFLEAADKKINDNNLVGRCEILYFDFSGMRFFNANYGFPAGDALLSHFAKLLREVFPERYCARFGEDHFVVLSENGEWNAAMDKLHEGLDTYFLSTYGKRMAGDGGSDKPQEDDNAIRIGLRCGVCAITQKVPVGNACDRARDVCHSREMNQAFQVKIYDEKYESSVQNENYVLNHIDQAIREGQIKVYYQPVVRAMSEEICGEEALARWDDPYIGIYAPYKFIPVLEEHKILYKVDLFIAEQVLRDFETKKKEGLACLPVSINLSRSDFEGRDMPTLIAGLCDQYHCPHHLIDIEITESAYTADPDQIDKAVEAFHRLGFKVWMDDFGSGYSSLNMLQDTKFDLIKLDMRFLKNFGRKNEMIISSILTMASRVGIDTLTEGVETKEQKDFLAAAGCGRLQGYYYDRPQPLGEVIRKQKSGEQVPYENPAHASFLDAVGRVDLKTPFAVFADENVHGVENAFTPMIVRCDRDGSLSLLRYLCDEKTASQTLGVLKPEILAALPAGEKTSHWTTRQIRNGDSVTTLYLHVVEQEKQTGAVALLVVTITTKRNGE